MWDLTFSKWCWLIHLFREVILCQLVRRYEPSRCGYLVARRRRLSFRKTYLFISCDASTSNSAKLLHYLITYWLTYLLNPCSTVLLEELTGSQLFKKFPAFFKPEVSLPHLKLPAICPYPKPARPSPYPSHSTSWILILILSSYLRLSLPSGPFYLRFPHQNPVYASPLPHRCYMPSPSHSSRFDHPNNITAEHQMKT